MVAHLKAIRRLAAERAHAAVPPETSTSAAAHRTRQVHFAGAFVLERFPRGPRRDIAGAQITVAFPDGRVAPSSGCTTTRRRQRMCSCCAGPPRYRAGSRAAGYSGWRSARAAGRRPHETATDDHAASARRQRQLACCQRQPDQRQRVDVTEHLLPRHMHDERRNHDGDAAGTRDTRVIRKTIRAATASADSCVATRPHAKAGLRPACDLPPNCTTVAAPTRRRAKDRAGNHRKSTPFTASRDDRFDAAQTVTAASSAPHNTGVHGAAGSQRRAARARTARRRRQARQMRPEISPV